MEYVLGEYKYENLKIYKKSWWCFYRYRCIDETEYNEIEGVRRVNELCGIENNSVRYDALYR